MINQASRYINNMPIGERDCEDAGDVKAPSTYMQTIKSREQWLQATAKRRNALRSAEINQFCAANKRQPMRTELDRLLDKINRQIVAEFGPEPKVRM